MKLRLEAFEKVSVLQVSQTVSLEDARVLAAGVSKLVGLGRPWVLIDLSYAVIEEQAGIFLKQLQGVASSAPSSVNFCWIGGFPNFCKFEDLTDALEKLKFKEIKEISSKLDLELTKENLSRILSARERVVHELDVNKKPIELLEREYMKMNINLRAAQTHLINRLLDPVFADLWSELVAESSYLAEFEEALGSEELKVAQAAVSKESVSPIDLYQATNLAQAIAQLRNEVKELQARAGKKFRDGKADRSVSLILENEAIRERIREVKEAWLQKLEFDAVMTEQDFKQGFKPILEEIKKKNELKKVSASAAESKNPKKAA